MYNNRHQHLKQSLIKKKVLKCQLSKTLVCTNINNLITPKITSNKKNTCLYPQTYAYTYNKLTPLQIPCDDQNKSFKPFHKQQQKKISSGSAIRFMLTTKYYCYFIDIMNDDIFLIDPWGFIYVLLSKKLFRNWNW